METKNNIIPYMATSPGQILKRELEARGITQKEFAEQLGMKPSNLNLIINGKIAITERFALKLQEALGIDAESWMSLQKGYEYDTSMIAQREKKLQIFEKTDKIIIPLSQLLDMQQEVERLNSRLNFIIASQKKNRITKKKTIKQKQQSLKE